MIVVDASAVTEWLLQTDRGLRVESRLHGHNEDLHAPHLVDVEVLSALRRLVRAREVSPARAADAIDDLIALRLTRHGHADLATRAWALRGHLTAYDAIYVALAEALDATVVTCDGPFSHAPGHSARIELIEPPSDDR